MGKRPLTAAGEAKAFAQALCAAMANDSPERFVMNMAKRVRQGRIFLDYLRNDRMSTVVAPLSSRLRPGALGSMPLNWPQVKKDLEPRRYTIHAAPAPLKLAAHQVSGSRVRDCAGPKCQETRRPISASALPRSISGPRREGAGPGLTCRLYCQFDGGRYWD